MFYDTPRCDVISIFTRYATISYDVLSFHVISANMYSDIQSFDKVSTYKTYTRFI